MEPYGTGGGVWTLIYFKTFFNVTPAELNATFSLIEQSTYELKKKISRALDEYLNDRLKDSNSADRSVEYKDDSCG